MAQYIAIDVGGTAIKYGLADENCNILERHKTPTEAQGGGPVIVKKVMDIVSRYKDKADGVAISTAGMVDTEKGRIFYAGPTIPNYAGTEYKQIIEKTFSLPCEVENDVNCAGLAEALLGAGRGCESMLCLTVGTGIGGCFVLNGQVYHGHSGSGCEVGYMHMRGSSFEQLGATSVMTRSVSRRKLLESDPSALDGLSEEAAAKKIRANQRNWGGRDIFDAARCGDLICIDEIEKMCDVLGQGIANICYVLNPEIVILGGGVMAQKEYLYPRVRSAMDRYLVSSIAENTRLAMAERENDAGMTGAVLHFLQKQKT